jgi:hypothetical protein
MAEVTHQQADLMLKLYEMRREPRLRQARAWYVENYHVTSMQDAQSIAPPGSDANAMVRMVLSYWDMCANIVNRGLIDEEFFFETSGEQFIVWERVKPIVNEIRGMFKNPLFMANLEEHCKRLEAWRERRAPGSSQAMREFMKRMAEAQRGGAARAAS